MRTGCYICGKNLDKFYIWATPDGKKYKICNRCLNLAKAFSKNSPEESEENAIKEQ